MKRFLLALATALLFLPTAHAAGKVQDQFTS
jgi:opacity protein-like surface antigen